MRRIVAVLSLLGLPLVASAQTPQVGSLYPQQAAIRADHVGLVRLPLSADVLAECAPDLSDLRVFQGDREIAYYVDAEGRSQQARLVARARDSRRRATGTSRGRWSLADDRTVRARSTRPCSRVSVRGH